MRSPMSVGPCLSGCRVRYVLPAGQDFEACRDLCARDAAAEPEILNELQTRFALRRKSFPAERNYQERSVVRFVNFEANPNYSIEENTRQALWPPKPKLFFIALRIFMARG